MSLFSKLFPTLFPQPKPHFVGFEEVSTKPKSNPEFELLVSRNKKILLDRGILPNKFRFSGVPYFTYDFVKDEINPELKMMVPMMSDGLFDPSRREIIIGPDERNNRAWMGVFTYQDPDWNDLVNKINSSKRGYVFFLIKTDENYHYEVDTNRVRFVDLDTVNIPQ